MIISIYKNQPFIFTIRRYNWYVNYGFRPLKSKQLFKSKVMMLPVSRWVMETQIKSFLKQLSNIGFKFYVFKNLEQYYLMNLNNTLNEYKKDNLDNIVLDLRNVLNNF